MGNQRPSSSAPSAAPVRRPGPARPRHNRRRLWWLLGVVGLLLVVGVGAASSLRNGQALPVPTVTPTGGPRLMTRGRIEPLNYATVKTLTGGVVIYLPIRVGDQVAAQQEVARVRATGGTVEVLTAPWAGTVLAVPVHLGDTVLTGAPVVSVGDLSQLIVRTTDVDEYLLPYLYEEQPVTVIVDALDGRELRGYVRHITLYPQASSAGDEHFPVEIALAGATADLRPGMSVRIIVPPSPDAKAVSTPPQHAATKSP